MCVAAGGALMSTLIGSAFTVGTSIVNNKIQRKTDEYKTQVALNQIKSQQNEAQRQAQLGIDKSREERIQGLKAVSKATAQNASNGFDTYSDTNLYNYEDIKDEYDYSANNIMEEYNSNAQKYDEQAKNSIAEYNFQRDNEKLNSLGNTVKVAYKWYKQGGLNGNF